MRLNNENVLFAARRLLFPLLIVLCLLQGGFSMKAYAVSNIHTDKILMKGIDVSRWQGHINWASVKKAGIKFVMIGLGRHYADGSGYLDPYFKYNIEKANEYGLKVGVYLYSTAATTAHAKREAEWVLKQIDGYKITFPVAFDMELPSIQSLPTSRKTDIALTFLKAIKKAGYYPMMYASESWFYEGITLSRIQKYDKWVARWSSGMTFNPVSIWQYSSTGRVSGISGAVDLDYCYKDYSSIITPRYHAKNAKFKKTGWHTNGIDHWYVGKNKKVLTSRFLKKKGKVYYLDKYGNRVTGWKKIDKARYFFDEKGVRQTGWLKDGKKLFYLSPRSGKCQKGWLTLEGKTYYLDPKEKGAVTFKWKQIKGKWYYFHKKKGYMYRSCTHNGYKFDENGVCADYGSEDSSEEENKEVSKETKTETEKETEKETDKETTKEADKET